MSKLTRAQRILRAKRRAVLKEKKKFRLGGTAYIPKSVSRAKRDALNLIGA